MTDSDVRSVINAWSGNQIPAVADKAADEFAKANPQTPEDRAKVANKIAATIADTAIAARDSQP